MSSLAEKSVLFFLVIFLLGVVAQDKEDDPCNSSYRGTKRIACYDGKPLQKEEFTGGMWFGSRPGKRSLRPVGEDNRQTYIRLLEAADALKYYYDQLQFYDAQADDEARVTKKVIFTPKLGRSLSEEKRYESVDFTPRLGRRLADDMPATPSDHDYYRPEPDQIDSRTKYFSPRLGRTMNNHYSPRLGRDLAYEMYPNKIRVVRSTNKTKTT